MALSKHELKEVRLEVREYFDHFLKEVLPPLMVAHINGCQHGKRVNRFKWAAIGGVCILAILVPTFGRSIIQILFKV